MHRLRLAAVVLALAAALVPAAQAGQPERDLRALVNAERAALGLGALRPAPVLSRAADRYADTLLRRGVLAHQARIGAPPWFRALGENLAMVDGRTPRPERAVALWLASPAHRAVMLHPAMRSIGIGRASGAFAGRPASVWVLRVGAR
jgi:uncharacterized protein YkwD